VDLKGYLQHRGKLWVPGALIVSDSKYNDLEPDLKLNDILRTRIIQSVYDSSVYGHLGRDATSLILARDFY
jgi:hypothetical protein